MSLPVGDIRQSPQDIRKAYHPDELTILVVEDHTLFARELRHALQRHNVVIARSVEEGHALYENYLPDIIFLDIDLPDGSGFELLDYIHERESGAYVVMLTGSKIEDDVIMSRNKGARGYVIKPFTKSKIDKQITEFLNLREKEMHALLKETEKHRAETLNLKTRDIVIT